MKIKYRLTLLFVAVIAASASATLVIVRRAAEDAFRSLAFSGDRGKAEAYALLLSEYREKRGDWSGVQEFLEGLPGVLAGTVDARLHREPGLVPGSESTMRALLADRVVVADEGGTIVADTARLSLGTVHPKRHLMHGMPVISGGRTAGTVLVGSMVDSSLTGAEENFLDSLLRAIFWSILAAAAVALPMGFLFASQLTKPIGRLAAAAAALASGERAAPLPAKGLDELSALSRSFNEMSAELGRLDEAKKRVIADSAHELRTPLTLIQGMIEGMIDGVLPLDGKTLESVHEETLRLSRLVDRLRELEIIESGELVLESEAVDLEETLRRAMTNFGRAAAEKSISLDYRRAGPKPPLARGDKLRIDEVVYNVVENAIKYTPSGGRVRLSAFGALSAFGGEAGFEVEDSGPGIPPEERERVFERFFRLDASRSTESGGRGLGLAISREIVKAHGGSIAVDESELGGARLRVRLPAFAG